jgi:hypothetical protein
MYLEDEMDRLLFARAINDVETALAIQQCDQVLVGVAILAGWTSSIRFGAYGGMKTQLDFHWVWWQYGDLDDFMSTRGWERPPAQIESRLQIEHKE